MQSSLARLLLRVLRVIPMADPPPVTVGCKSFGGYVLLWFKQQQQDLTYNRLNVQSINVLQLVWPSGITSSLAHETSEFEPRACPINILYNSQPALALAFAADADQPASPLSLAPSWLFLPASPLPPQPLLWLAAPHLIWPPPTASPLSLQTAPNSRMPCLPPPALPFNWYHPCPCFTSGLYVTAPKP